MLIGGGAADEAELARPIERGIYVNRLWYVNPVREKETLLTGVTRDGTFLIEDGEITRPLRDVRFTDSALGVLDRDAGAHRRAAAHHRRRVLRPALRDRDASARRCAASGLRITGGA